MIAVVGGGLTGLAVGLELQARGKDFVVLEARNRPGGVIRSEHVDGRVLDFGPQRTRRVPGVARLIAALGLENELLTAKDGLALWVHHGGELHRVPFSLPDLLASHALGVGAKLRLLLEPFTRGADPEERVDAFFRRKVGREIYETFLAPLYGGLYASDPADMEVGTSLIHALRAAGAERSLVLALHRRGGAVRPPAAVSFASGMEALPRAMARAISEHVRLDTPVRGIGRSGTGWTVETDDGPLDARAVVITTPADVTARLMARVAPRTSTALKRLRYNPLGIVHLDAETDLEGLGFQVAFGEATMLRGVTFNDSLFGRSRLYTAYLGGARHTEVAEMSEDRLAGIAVSEFQRVTGCAPRALRATHARVPAWDTSWRALADVALPHGIHAAAPWRSRPGIPGRLADAARVAAIVSEAG